MIMKRNAFTLIELMIVIGIIGLLATVIGASVNSARTKSRDGKRIADLSQIQKAFSVAYGQLGLYPVGSNVTLGVGTAKVLCGKGQNVVLAADVSPANCDSGKIYMGLVPQGQINPYIYNTTNTTTNMRVCTTLEIGNPQLNVGSGPIAVDESSNVKNVGSCP